MFVPSWAATFGGCFCNYCNRGDFRVFPWFLLFSGTYIPFWVGWNMVQRMKYGVWGSSRGGASVNLGIYWLLLLLCIYINTYK